MDQYDYNEDRRTETDFAVEELRAETCAHCARRGRGAFICRLLLAYEVYREVPDEWNFELNGDLLCVKYEPGDERETRGGQREHDGDGDQA